MAWLPRLAILGVAVAVLAAALTLGNPSPPAAQANVVCEVGISPAATVGDAVGIGNPVGDVCDALSDGVLGVADKALGPLKDAAASIGRGVFNEITAWAADGAVWLLGEVVELTEQTTSPDLLSKGFLRQYRQMASIAVVLALAMLILAALEGLGRGDPGMLWRVFLVNVPVAALATSAAYVVVQLLIAATDDFSDLIARSTAHDTREFFKGAVQALAEVGGDAGALAGAATNGPGVDTTTTEASGAIAVPLFVGFIAAILAAFAAFLLWVELLMRSAAIYVVALFMPLAIAASIWPRWMSALRRTGELVIVLVASKFVIVAVIALAASLLANTEGKVEHVLSAGALLLLACFAPFVLFKLVPFAEAAAGSAFNRQSAGSAGKQAIHTASSVQMMRRSAHANWAGASKEAGATNGGGNGGKPPGAGGSGGSGAGEAAGAGVGAAGVAALPLATGVGAAKASQAAGERLEASGVGRAAVEASGDASSAPSQDAIGASGGGDERSPRPPAAGASGGEKAPSPSTSATPEPTEAKGGSAPGAENKAPRPSGEASAPSKGIAGNETKS